MPENNLEELMFQAEALRTIPVETSFEWFDDMIPKAQRLLQQIQHEQASCANNIGSQMFNKVRDCCNSMENWIRQLNNMRTNFESQKNNMIKYELDRLSIHSDSYSSFRGFFGK